MISWLLAVARDWVLFFCARDYLAQSGLPIDFKSFVRPICEYSNIVFMGPIYTNWTLFRG